MPNSTQFEFEMAFGKLPGSSAPPVSTTQQVSAVNTSVDSTKINKIGGAQKIDWLSLADNIQIDWSLNSNPYIILSLNSSFPEVLNLLDSSAFDIGNLVGVRFSKETQTTDWIYGVIATPTSMTGEKNLLVIESFGLLYEAARRKTATNFKRETGASALSRILKKYGIIGPLFVLGTAATYTKQFRVLEQNESDLSMLHTITSFFDSWWYLEANSFKVINRDIAYSRPPIFEIGPTRAINKTELDKEKVMQTSEIYITPYYYGVPIGAVRLTAQNYDLDTGLLVRKIIRAKATKLGARALTSEALLSDSGVFINNSIIRPRPPMEFNESEVFVPLIARSDDESYLQYFVEERNLFLEGTVILPTGSPRVRPGDIIKVTNMGQSLSGNYVVIGVQHKITSNPPAFITELKIARNAVIENAKLTTEKINAKPVDLTNTAGIGATKELQARKF